MKAVLKMTTVIAFMFVAAISMAKEPKLVLTAYSDAKMLVLELENVAKATSIEFKDAQNNIIYSESVSKLLYSRKFNLKNLNSGIYYFETENEMKSIVYSIKIEGDEVIILDKKEVNKPFFRKVENHISFNLLNLDKQEVKITVNDESNRVVFNESIMDKLIVEKSFDFSDAFKGEYVVSVTVNGKNYKENLIVD
ncbi:hypothetical protein [uncultured Maribacter sp.]|uniref:hypothetical protein n=1 Tax=uncultured Maribacter sp. TaxID=431308 RepID=UPI00262B30AB|nr:hypothetical protein [uncultured Maribacter sp.]